MKHEDKIKLVNNVITNEFNHLQEELSTDKEIISMSKKVDDLYDKLIEKDKKNSALIEEISEEQIEYLSFMIRYYFKLGVKAGITNLNFLKDTRVIEVIK